jgi:hypothetical protein
VLIGLLIMSVCCVWCSVLLLVLFSQSTVPLLLPLPRALRVPVIRTKAMVGSPIRVASVTP